MFSARLRNLSKGGTQPPLEVEVPAGNTGPGTTTDAPAVDIRPPLLGIGQDTYLGSILRNFVANLLPAIYVVLSKVWVARIDPTLVALTDTFNYISAIAEVINQGFPRGGWTLVADNRNRPLEQRYRLAFTSIVFVTILDLIMTVSVIVAAPRFAANFVPAIIRHASFTYIRLTTVSIFCSVINNALSISTRALDQPDVPLLIQSVKFGVNIVLDMLLVSRFRPARITPTVNTQALIRAICDVVSLISGLAYCYLLARKKYHLAIDRSFFARQEMWIACKQVLKQGYPLQMEVIPRTVLLLWFSARVITLGLDFATAWGVFFAVRIGLLSAPINAIQASCLAFTGHTWATVVSRRSSEQSGRPAFAEVLRIVAISVALALVIEVPLCFLGSYVFARKMGFYLSNSSTIADLVEQIWRRTEWAFIFLACEGLISSILLVADPPWLLYQTLFKSVVLNLPFVLVFHLYESSAKFSWSLLILPSAVVFVLALVNTLCWTAIWVRRKID